MSRKQVHDSNNVYPMRQSYQGDVESHTDSISKKSAEMEKSDSQEPDTSDKPMPNSRFMAGVASIQSKISYFYHDNRKWFKWGFIALLFIGAHAFFIAALVTDWRRAVPLIVLFSLFWIGLIYYLVVKPYLIPPVSNALQSNRIYTKFSAFLKRPHVPTLISLVILLCVVSAIAIEAAVKSPQRLMPFLGLIFFICFLFIFSHNPAAVNWRPVFVGLTLQFLFGVLVLHWSVGYEAFDWLAQQINAFMLNVNVGSEFVFGTIASSPPQGLSALGFRAAFAFQVLPVVIFFSSVIALLYYYGIMQFLLTRLADVVRVLMGTTAAESLVAAANIFLGMTEAPMMIRPYLNKMTDSEIHSIMTSGFATISGSIFTAYIAFGACPTHLLSSCIMSAPAALAVSKLFYPETEKSKTKSFDDMKMEESVSHNALEAVSNAAVTGMQLLLAITANLIVFLAGLAFLNNVVAWLGLMVGVEDMSFQKLLSYLFFPLAYLMGASSLTEPTMLRQDLLYVAELLGVKTFLNEFVAYERFGKMIHCCQLSPRAQLISTYCLSGFSNFGSIGIEIGALSTLCSEKTPTFARLGLHAMIAGSVACFMTACVAGILSDAARDCDLKIDLFKNLNCTLEFGGNGTACLAR